jgi:hypothetical protein
LEEAVGQEVGHQIAGRVAFGPIGHVGDHGEAIEAAVVQAAGGGGVADGDGGTVLAEQGIADGQGLLGLGEGIEEAEEAVTVVLGDHEAVIIAEAQAEFLLGIAQKLAEAGADEIQAIGLIQADAVVAAEAVQEGVLGIYIRIGRN